MRPRTPNFLWLPFVFSIGTISWALLLAGLAIIAAVVVVPAYDDVCKAKAVKNDIQATEDLLNQKIEMQKEFIAAATKDPVLMERLASRQLNLFRKDQEFLRDKDGKPLDPEAPYKDHSVDTLLAESLVPVSPKPADTIPAPLNQILNPATRTSLIILACAAMAVSFFLGVKYDRS